MNLVAVNHRRAHYRLFELHDITPVISPPHFHVQGILLEENTNQQRRENTALHGGSHLSVVDERPKTLRPQVRPSSVRFQICWIGLGSKSNLMTCALATLKVPRKRLSKAHLGKKEKLKKKIESNGIIRNGTIKSYQILTDAALSKR